MHRYFEEEGPAEDADDDDVDAADALKAQSQSMMKERNWDWLDTGAKNVLFCKVTGTDITKIAEWFVSTCQAGNESRHLMRLYPVHDSGRVETDVLEELCKKHLQTILTTEGAAALPTYRIDYIKRNNNVLSRNEVFEVVGDVMKTMSLMNRVNLTSPDVVLIVQAHKNKLLFSYARNYDARRKFSLRPLPQPGTEEPSVSLEKKTEDPPASLEKEAEKPSLEK
uniref:THUMP domain-containing protein n=1 Tax=Steinernema glaseri TaxID=37863 RepID=A0A1I7Y868_9BILA